MTTEVTKNLKNQIIAFMQQDQVKSRFTEILGAKSAAFISSVLAAVNANDQLKKATPESVYMAAMMAAVVDLPINPNLGFAYIIPYNKKDESGNWVSVAQFQMGYKGFIQLGQRSGQYKSMSAAPVYEGQLKSQDPLKGFEFDWTAKASDKVIGYAGYFQLLNGFEKTLFMTTEDLQKHGKRYSKTFDQNSSKWKTDFEGMAMKTVLKLLISKFGPLSVDTQMQKAIIADQAVIKDADTLDVEYTDSKEEPALLDNKQSEEITRIREMIATVSDVVKLEKMRTQINKLPDDVKNELTLELAEKIEKAETLKGETK